jgi:predicted nucleotidyltransferase
VSFTKNLAEQKLIDPPRFVPEGLQFEAIMGSYAFGAATEGSDKDVMGFCIPSKHLVFPHLQGVIDGFDLQKERFDQFEKHHVLDANGNEFDFNIYSIAKFFALALDGNPTLLDALYAPLECCTYISGIARQVRDQRDIFLHKGCWKRYRGYCGQMIHKMNVKDPQPGSRRFEIVKQYGYDVKFAAHAVRLVLEGLQILKEGTLDIRANADIMKDIRTGCYTQVEVKNLIESVEREGEALYLADQAKVPYKRREAEVKALLVHCLEEHFGSLKDAHSDPGSDFKALTEIANVLRKNNIPV